MRRESQEHRADQRESARSASERRAARENERAERGHTRKAPSTGPHPPVAGEEAPFERELETQTQTAAATPSKGSTPSATSNRKTGEQDETTPAQSEGAGSIDTDLETVSNGSGSVNTTRRGALDGALVPTPRETLAPDAAPSVGFVVGAEPGVDQAEAETTPKLEVEGESADAEHALASPAPTTSPHALSANTGAAASERGASTESVAPREHSSHAAAAEEPNTNPQHALRADETRASEVLRQVRVAITPELKHAVIHLHPAELGRISIRLTVEDEGLVARVRAEKREAIDALEKHLPELRAALSRQGIQTQQFHLALGFQDERKPGDARAGRSPHARGRTPSEAVSENDEPIQHVRRVLSESAIDTYA
ncbi:MAG: flagellar hook-length control protein FliK [Planctomycetes bacterium]|nr:flagellar hook-length control protein FliK [Planctomycetota bacterium]